MMYDDHLEIRFPEGSLEHAATEQQVSLSYTDEVKALLQDWAIPDNGAYLRGNPYEKNHFIAAVWFTGTFRLRTGNVA